MDTVYTEERRLYLKKVYAINSIAKETHQRIESLKTQIKSPTYRGR